MFTEPHNLPPATGWIEVICGSMFSGKTEELLRRLHRAELAGQRIRLFKPALDRRYDEVLVVSHSQRKLASIPVHKATDILAHVTEAQVVAVDEAQFFDEAIVVVANQLADSGKRVILSGLDMDFNGQPFGPMPKLLCVAEFVTKLHAVCVRTGTMAQYSHLRSGAHSGQVLVGGLEHYEPLSRAVFVQERARQRPGDKETEGKEA